MYYKVKRCEWKSFSWLLVSLKPPITLGWHLKQRTKDGICHRFWVAFLFIENNENCNEQWIFITFHIIILEFGHEEASQVEMISNTNLWWFVSSVLYTWNKTFIDVLMFSYEKYLPRHLVLSLSSYIFGVNICFWTTSNVHVAMILCSYSFLVLKSSFILKSNRHIIVRIYMWLFKAC